jgi:hypothetical protein
MTIESHFDPLTRRVTIVFDEGDCYAHGARPGEPEKGYVPRTLLAEAVKVARPRTTCGGSRSSG